MLEETGKTWVVWDRMHNEDIFGANVKSLVEEECAYYNTGADWFCNKPRYEVREEEQ